MKIMKSLLCAAGTLAIGHSALAADVVISQIYGGAGCTSPVTNCSTYGNDYIELYNRSAAPVTMTGWSVQYASATGTGAWTVTTLPTFTLQPGQYFLVAEAAGATGSGINVIPTADATGTIAMSGTNGKVALVSSTTALSGACPVSASIVDKVGYGTTPNCFETAVTGTALSTTSAAFRKNNGCQDTDNNASDFLAAAPSPRNSSTISPCSPSTPPAGVGSVAPSPTCPGSLLTFTVTTTSGTNPTAAITSVTGDFQAIGLTGAEVFTQGQPNSWTFTTTLNNVSAATYSFPITITDAQSRVGSASISLQVFSCNPFIPAATATASPSGLCNGATTVLSVVVQPGQNPTSASMTVTADLSSIGDANPATFSLTGPNTYTYVATVANGTVAGPKPIVVTAIDDQLRSGTRTLNLVNAPCGISSSTVVISQVYGGGGNSGATLINDFVELFNRSSSPVDITGWSVQYASASDANGGFASGNPTTNVPVALSGTLQPGQYYLVQLSAGAGGSQALPTPDATGGILVGATAGRIALVDNTTALLTDCASTHIRDLVGYGEGTGAPLCYEGDLNVGPTETLDNTTAAIRNQAGCQDTDRNRVDFTVGLPTPRNTASPIHLCGPAPVGSCCATNGTCSISAQVACGSGSTWTSGGTCTPNTCPQPASGVCCRGSTCNTTFASAAACAAGLTGSPTAGAFFVTGTSSCNASATVNTPCCYADYNKIGGISVQDIFDFLSDWFAGFPYANTGGNGTVGTLQVQNIFDFLSDWFAGGC